jgi:uncharacterized membrane protein
MKINEGEPLTLVLLEEIMSLVEVLWDIAMAVIIVRLAFLYCLFTFLTGCIFGFIRLGYVVPVYHVRASTAELFEMPIMVLVTVFWAWFTIRKFEIPKVAWMRLAVGLVGLLFMLVTEFVGRVILYEEGWTKGILEEDLIASEAFGGTLLVFGLMPWLLMVAQEKEQSVTKAPPPKSVEMKRSIAAEANA